MTFRKTLFWLHLGCGVAAGLVIAVMCFTGVTLAFEKQLVAWADRDARRVEPAAPGTARLPLPDLLRQAREKQPDSRPSALVVSADPREAVALQFGREGLLYANPYTGELRPSAATSVRNFLHTMEDWHRWLALGGDQRPVGKLINGVGNAVFLVLALTGLYLWMPRRWSWSGVRAVALFNWKLAGKARDFNWHNSIGLWCSPVLIVLTLTALPMSFRWANDLIYRLTGSELPAQSGPGGGAPFAAPAVELPAPPPGARPLGYDALIAAAQKELPAWETVTLRLGGFGARGGARPAGEAGAVRRENPGQERRGGGQGADAPAGRRNRSGEGENRGEGRRGSQPVTLSIRSSGQWPLFSSTTLTLDPFTGNVLKRDDFSDQSAGRRLRSWTRFLHTGEALGLAGQLIAALASIGGCFLVYTGFALTWRRFFGRKSPPSA